MCLFKNIRQQFIQDIDVLMFFCYDPWFFKKLYTVYMKFTISFAKANYGI